jgi:hypothetical protein
MMRLRPDYDREVPLARFSGERPAPWGLADMQGATWYYRMKPVVLRSIRGRLEVPM